MKFQLNLLRTRLVLMMASAFSASAVVSACAPQQTEPICDYDRPLGKYDTADPACEDAAIAAVPAAPAPVPVRTPPPAPVAPADPGIY